MTGLWSHGLVKVVISCPIGPMDILDPWTPFSHLDPLGPSEIPGPAWTPGPSDTPGHPELIWTPEPYWTPCTLCDPWTPLVVRGPRKSKGPEGPGVSRVSKRVQESNEVQGSRASSSLREPRGPGGPRWSRGSKRVKRFKRVLGVRSDPSRFRGPWGPGIQMGPDYPKVHNIEFMLMSHHLVVSKKKQRALKPFP